MTGKKIQKPLSKPMKKALDAVGDMQPMHNRHEANLEHAALAGQALANHARATLGDEDIDDMTPGDLASAVQGLITDLLHFWGQRRRPRDYTPEQLATRAVDVYEMELPETEQ